MVKILRGSDNKDKNEYRKHLAVIETDYSKKMKNQKKRFIKTKDFNNKV